MINRHEQQELLERARAQAHSAAAGRDQHRRRALAEGSFADAANNHGFKRSRWRRLWRQQIQDWLIAAIQNVRILMRRAVQKRKAAATALLALGSLLQEAVLSRLHAWYTDNEPSGICSALQDNPI